METTYKWQKIVVFIITTVLVVFLISNYFLIHYLLMFEVIKKDSINEVFFTQSALLMFVGLCFYLDRALKVALNVYKEIQEIRENNKDEKLKKLINEVFETQKKQ